MLSLAGQDFLYLYSPFKLYIDICFMYFCFVLSCYLVVQINVFRHIHLIITCDLL